MRGWSLFVLALCWAGAVAAAPTQADLRRIEQQIQAERASQKENQRKAVELSGEVRTVQNQMVKLAHSIQEKEETLSALEKKQEQSQARQAELEKRLAMSDQQLVRVVTGMQTLALRPPELLLFQASAPLNMLRSRMMMQYSLPVIGGVNRQTRSDLAELSQLRSSLQQQIVQIKAATTQLSERSAQMDKLYQQKSLLQAQYKASQDQASKRVQALAAQASDLKDLLAKLAAEKKRQEEQMRATQSAVQYIGQSRPSFRMPATGTALVSQSKPGSFAKVYGQLLYPIRGNIVQSFGDTTIAGAHTRGMTLRGRARAQVVAPSDGTVLFAGPFKNYGQLLILDNGDNYLTLLAGMARIDTNVGQTVLAGEPIGQMKDGNPDLYIEIRKDGQPVDPAPWFVSRG